MMSHVVLKDYDLNDSFLFFLNISPVGQRVGLGKNCSRYDRVVIWIKNIIQSHDP